MAWKITLLVLVLLTLALVALVTVNSRRLDQTNRELAHRLLADSREPVRPPADLYEALPAPVTRYLGRALPGGIWPGSVRLTQRGEILQGGAWREFTAVQHITASPPGFVWDAHVRFAPLIAARVIDMYASGHGALRAKLLGTLTVADAAPSRALDESELLRYLAEGPWLPTVLAPRPDLEWSAVDESTARATLTAGDSQVSLMFTFDEQGDAVRVEGDRPRDVEGGAARVEHWVGRFWNYSEQEGVRLPLEGEVGWLGEHGVEPYWRGRIETIEFD